MASTAATVRRGRKFDQVIAGAREVFLSDGFEGASVDDIARVARVSKATLYSYFPDKRLLFMEVARAECLRQADEYSGMIDPASPPRVVLRDGARRLLGFFLSEFGQRVYRMCIAESDRFPDLGRQFYDSGPALARERISEYLNAACARGELAIGDVGFAADQFIELCKADLFPRAMCGLSQDFNDDEIDRVIDGAVDMFLARYGTGGQAA